MSRVDRLPPGARQAPVLVTDDHAVMRQALCAIIDAQPLVRVAGKANDA
jgi:chemotaxis response regulator CheB